MITSALLSWEFYVLTSETTDTLGNNLFPTTGGRSAYRPTCNGIGCRAADIKYWDADERFWGSDVALSRSGVSHGFYDPGGGSIDLLSLFSSDSLLGEIVTFSGKFYWAPGRPFFETEGKNADTEFDVYGKTEGNIGATLLISFLPPPVKEEVPADVPEPALLGLFGAGLAGIAYRIRRRP